MDSNVSECQTVKIDAAASTLRHRIERALHNLNGRKIAIWGTRMQGERVKQICSELGYPCSFFVSSRPKTNMVYGLPLRLPEVLDVKRHYVLLTTGVWEVRDYLLEKGFSEYNWRDTRCVAPVWDDLEFEMCSIGRGTYGYETFQELKDRKLGSFVKCIGRYCSINNLARVWENHPLNYVSTHPYFCYELDRTLPSKLNCINISLHNRKLIEVGNDVWIGANSILLEGVKIGDGAVIGAGAIVSHDVEPYAIVGGVPARIIRYRYSPKMVDAFLRIKWWEWPMEKIEENLELFFQPELFCRTFDSQYSAQVLQGEA